MRFLRFKNTNICLKPKYVKRTTTSKIDGGHLDEDLHLALGKAMARKVASLLAIGQPKD